MHPKLTDDIPVGKVHKIYHIVCSEMKGRWGRGGGGKQALHSNNKFFKHNYIFKIKGE